jgi:hypothetical protein
LQGSLLGFRGFKYGVLNTEPIKPGIVFRYDRFGQFRDMLEPRVDSRFVLANTIGESAVNVLFVDRDTGLKTEPTFTTSSNKSSFYTSSLPYFDGDSRN